MYPKHFVNANIVHQKYVHYYYLFYHLLMMNKNIFSQVKMGVSISNLSIPNSEVKCLKSLSSKFDVRVSRELL